MYCFLLHIFISFNPRTTHQTSQSQAMQVWTHLRPRSPLHTSLNLLNALHLNHGTTFCQVQKDQINVHNSGMLCIHWWLSYLSRKTNNLILYSIFDHWRYQRGNQNPYIEEEQTTQWPKEKGQRTIYETYTKTCK
jgi:hypothetical protein